MDENQFSWRSMIQQQNWQEDMINKYETPAAQVRMYKEAGLNPYQIGEQGVNVNTPSSPGGMSSASVNSGSDLSSIISAIAQLALQKGNLENQQKQTDIAAYNAETQRISATAGARKDNADAEGREIQNYIDENTKDMQIELRGLNIEQVKANIANVNQNTEESKERIDQIKATIRQIDKNIELTDKQIQDLTQLIDIHRLEKEKLEAVKPYFARMAAAELALTEARTEEALQIAGEAYQQASSLAYENLVKLNILSGVDSEGNIDPDLKYENPAAYKALLEIQSAGVVAESEAKESAAHAEVYGKVGWQRFGAIMNPLTNVLSTISNFMIAGSAISASRTASRGYKTVTKETKRNHYDIPGKGDYKETITEVSRVPLPPRDDKGRFKKKKK